jgi:hypothetical protein
MGGCGKFDYLVDWEYDIGPLISLPFFGNVVWNWHRFGSKQTGAIFIDLEDNKKRPAYQPGMLVFFFRHKHVLQHLYPRWTKATNYRPGGTRTLNLL